MAQANVVNTLVVPAQSRVAPFYDDFDESKNFHRIMFRPGYAVQARELTQLQTILQNQVERFGRHIFVNGSSVIGGKLDVTDIITLNVQPEFANSFITVSDFKDKTIRLSSGNNDVLARVVQTSNATDTSPPALHIKYLTGQEFTQGATVNTTTGNLTLSLVNTSNVASNGKLAFLYDSIYFMQGYFIKVPSQSVVVSKYQLSSNARVGLELSEEIVTENSDTSLLDPALESSNFQAPGAARYKVELVLSTRSLDSQDDEKFIELAKIDDGVIKERVKTPLYSEIEEVLARRTYDESGNYIVKPYNLRVEESRIDPTNNFSLIVSAGKSYIYGFETESLVDTTIEIPRSRETEPKSDYDLNLNYGNFVIVEDLTGPFNIQNQSIIDLHCVDKANVSYANSTTYNSTKVGTARVSDINFYSGSSNVSTRQFELYFYDNKFRTLNANAGGTSLATNQVVMNTAQTSAVTDAYTRAYIFIEAGPNAGERREIISYNGASKIANVAPAFSALCNVNSRYTIQYDITDVDSFIQSVNYTGSATANASATISLINKDNGSLNGNTYIFEPAFRRMFFLYPEKYVAPGITDKSYVYRKTYPTIQFTSGESATITASQDEEFEGTTSTSNVSSTVMDNFLVIVTNPLSSARTVGEQVRVTSSVSNQTPEQAVLNTGNTSESFIATIYSKMQARGTSAVQRVKSLVLANTQTFTTESVSNTFVNQTGSTTYVYQNSGQVVIINPSKLSSETESLFLSDVIAIPKIYAISGNTPPTAGSSLTGLQDVTSRYEFDFGQRSTHYDHAAIRLKTGYTSPGAIVVCCRYYRTSSDVGYFNVDSYPSLNSVVVEEGDSLGTGYSLIPYYSKIKLSDVVDFRPVRPNASNNETFNFTSARAPIATSDFTSSYSYYKKRKDIIAIAPNKIPYLVQGQSARNPVFPKIPERSILLHKLSLNPYTETTKDIYVDTISHRRYTMQDIGRIDQRLKSVEYSVRLNSLEKRADDISIKDVDGLDRTKYGILADNFDSPLLADVRLSDFQCSIDYTGKYSLKKLGGTLMPKLSGYYVDFTLKDESNVNVKASDNKITLDFTTEPAISQTTATKSTPVAEFLFAEFKGQLITVPSADIWRETKFLPPQVITTPTVQPVPIVNPPPSNVQPNPPTPPNPPWPPGPPPPCPDPDMMILLADGNKKRAGDLKVGDMVYTQHEDTFEWNNYPVSYVDIVKSDKKLLKFDNNVEIICSDSHKFHVKGKGWLHVTDIIIGDMISEKTLLDIKDYEHGDVVFITVDEAHTYICEGLLSHNKLPPRPPEPPPPTPPPPPPPEVERLLVALASTQYYNGLGGLAYDAVNGWYMTETSSQTPLTIDGVVQTAALTPQQIANYIEANIRDVKGTNISVSTDDVRTIYNAYNTFFDRPPEGVGYVYWADEKISNDWNPREFAEAIIMGGIQSGLKTVPSTIEGLGVDIVNGLYNYSDAGGVFSLSPLRDYTSDPDTFAYSSSAAYTTSDNQQNNQADTRADTIESRVTTEEFVQELYEQYAGWGGHQEGFDYWADQIESYGIAAATQDFIDTVNSAVDAGFNATEYAQSGQEWDGWSISDPTTDNIFGIE